MPQLIAAVNSRGPFFRMLTFRFDRDQSSFGNYDLKFKNLSEESTDEISGAFQVAHLPTLLVYDIMGRLVTREGYRDMMNYG